MPIALHRPATCEPLDLNQASCALSESKLPLDDAVTILFEYRMGMGMGWRSFKDISGLHLSLRPNGSSYKIRDHAPGDYKNTVLYADVYSAQGDSTGQNVALKISRLARNDTSKDSYLHEVAALFQSSKLRSPLSGALPNIVDAGEAWIQGQGVGLGVIVMELMPGLTFGNHLQQKRCHDENQLIEIISTYAQHLATLERNGIIHSDPSVDNLIIKVNDADNSISCATIDLGRSSLPRISEKQINSTHQWARSSNNSQQKGLIHFENVLAKAIRYSIRMNFDNNFIGLLQNITDRAAGTAYPNIRSFSELAECLQIAKEHVNNGNFHQLENLFGTGANHHSPPEAGY